MKINTDQHQSFGELLAALMRDKEINSDEQLARRAMRLQRNSSHRINVQRRTINNWRNNKSTPRSVDDQQFKLVAEALNLSDEKIEIFKSLIAKSTTNHQRPASLKSDASKRTLPFIPITRKWASLIFTALALAILIAGYVFANGELAGNDDTSISTTQAEIPSALLNLSDDGFVLPNSDKQVVTKEQLEKLTGWELYVARNEIFARKGRQFTQRSSMCLQNHFNRWKKSQTNPDGWYLGTTDDIQLSQRERDNAETIRDYECSARGGQYKCDSQLNAC